jgi:hypothetical protein
VVAQHTTRAAGNGLIKSPARLMSGFPDLTFHCRETIFNGITHSRRFQKEITDDAICDRPVD